MLTTTEIFDFAETLVRKPSKEKPPDPIQWIKYNVVDPITKKLIVLEEWQERIIRQALTIDNNGYSKYNLVVWSQTKKSGKTTIASAVGAYVANCIEAPNEVSCLANDQEQSAGRIFGNMLPSLKNLQWNVPVSTKGMYRSPIAYANNGSFVKAITTNYEKEAGANQGISLWSELWAYDSERLNRLWEEMTPPPTRKFRMRWVETYAGYIGESLLLQGIYLSVFKDFKESELQPNVKKIWGDLPVYEPNPHTLVFWDHDHRMPWQTEEYYQEQQTDMRPSSFRRLHGNWWVESSDNFITSEMWYKSVRQEVKKRKSTYALDASKSGDCTALIGCVRKGDLVETTDVHIWEVEPGREVNFKEVENTIYNLFKKGLIHPPLYYDPYQCAKLAQDLRSRGVPCEEFKQGVDRIKSDTFLYKLYKSGEIINPDHSLLRNHVLAAQAKVYDDDRVRIVKPSENFNEDGKESEEEKTTIIGRKVDAIVAQSMAAYRAYMRRTSGWGATSQELNK